LSEAETIVSPKDAVGGECYQEPEGCRCSSFTSASQSEGSLTQRVLFRRNVGRRNIRNKTKQTNQVCHLLEDKKKHGLEGEWTLYNFGNVLIF
jgi:hypothetical protein